jgi:cyclase
MRAKMPKRIIPCLDVKNGRVVKGVRFRDHQDLGDILERALAYRDAGADELVFYDIAASPEGRSVDPAWVDRVARELDIPFCVDGGIRDTKTAETILHAGADKISINTPALDDPDLITRLAERFGAQCVVVGIDSIRGDDGWQIRSYTGDPARMQSPNLKTLDWVAEVQRRGAGEIVLNCMNNDGVRRGYDIEQLKAVRAICDIPLVASGGAGTMAHFADAFDHAGVDAALAASVFHTGAIAIPDLKQYLQQHNIPMRS